MNVLALCLGIATFIVVMHEAVDFHHSTVCRQKAWEKSFELRTRALLPKSASQEFFPNPGCSLFITRKGSKVSWRRIPSIKSNEFQLSLRGKL